MTREDFQNLKVGDVLIKKTEGLYKDKERRIAKAWSLRCDNDTGRVRFIRFEGMKSFYIFSHLKAQGYEVKKSY